MSLRTSDYKECDELKSIVPLNLSIPEVEDAILKLLSSMPPRRIEVNQLISRQQLVKFLVFGTEVFRLGTTLVEFVVRDRCVVASDIHGSLDDLIITLRENGPPPDTQYLFLGDYVGGGKQQIDVFLLLLLLKLRWPHHVYLLRGVHECSEQNTRDTFFESCMDAYNDRKICALFTQIFDYMPIAAIVNDKVFCCHGGVSQWMTSRDAIRNIKRPSVLTTMNILESCLFTDLLWADPDPSQSTAFQVSPRRISYTFNEEGLGAALCHVNCVGLLRGNQDYEGGICVNFPGKCITVHTSNSEDQSKIRAAYLILKRRPGRLDVDCSQNTFTRYPVIPLSSMEYTEIMYSIAINYRKGRINEYLDILSRDSMIRHWLFNDISELHFASSEVMQLWLTKFAINELQCIPEFQNGGQGVTNIAVYARYFPVIVDSIRSRQGTFRVCLTDEEVELMKAVS